MLALEHGAIPPTVHYSSPNPAIDFAAEPVLRHDALHPWERNGTPRRAGVSSFGVGGTNAHAGARGGAAATARRRERRPHQLLTLSARSEAALTNATTPAGASTSSASGARSRRRGLHAARRPPRVPRTAASSSCASDDRGGGDRARCASRRRATEPPPSGRVVFMFPGQGAQYPGMAAGLYETRAGRPTRDRPLRAVLEARDRLPTCGEVLLPRRQRKRADAAEGCATRAGRSRRCSWSGTRCAQLWRSWGVKPAAMIGHSIGEYVAATLAGVMTLDDALRLIARRGRLISALPRGSMLAVMAPPRRRSSASSTARCAWPRSTRPGSACCPGPTPRSTRVEAALDARVGRGAPAAHVTRVPLGDDGSDARRVRGARRRHALSPPTIPFVATLTGDWAERRRDAADVLERADPLDRAVRRRVGTVLRDSRAATTQVFLEVGPGSTLATFAARRTAAERPRASCLTSIPGSGRSAAPDTEVMLGSLGAAVGARRRGRLGAASTGTSGGRGCRLPTYPFERRSYWIGRRRPGTEREKHEPRDTSGLVRHTGLARGRSDRRRGRRSTGQPRPGLRRGDRRRRRGGRVRSRGWRRKPSSVSNGAAFARPTAILVRSRSRRSPTTSRNWRRHAAPATTKLAGVIDCWSAAPPGDTDLDTAGNVSPCSRRCGWRHALSGQHDGAAAPAAARSARGRPACTPATIVDPPRALGVGVGQGLPQEHPGHARRARRHRWRRERSTSLVAELAAGAPEPDVALRGGSRFVETYDPLLIDDVGSPARSARAAGRAGHRRSRAHGHQSGRGTVRAARRAAGARRPDAAPGPEDWEAASEDPATLAEHARRCSAGSPRCAPSATTSWCSWPT